jgi:tetratricopeptide (TPR) repeat protein
VNVGPTWRLAVGRLMAATGEKTLGTAFAVEAHTLVTAFHCIGERATGHVVHRSVRWDLQGTRVDCTVLTGDPDADCAVLRLDGELPAATVPLPVADHVTAASWRATGYPASLRDLGPVTVSGNITSVDGQLRGIPALQLFAEQSAAGLALGGFSGAPVVATGSPGVIGVIRYNPPDPDAPERGIGGIVYACPVAAVRALLAAVGVQPAVDTSRPRASGTAASSRAPLPPDRAGFTGRAALIDHLLTALAVPGAVVAVHGQPGVGKSALAVHVAHLLGAHFPDARLHIDLRGADQRPIAVGDALERLLLALDVEAEQIGATAEVRTQQYRDALSGRQALVVLDNASSVAQLRPLLPPTPGCSTLVTSRQPMSTLDDAELIPLDVLDDAEARDLVATKLRDDPRAQDLANLTALVALCDRLPLALQIAAAQLRARTHWSVAYLVEQLENEQYRLKRLKVADLAVRASFDSSFSELSPPVAEAFAALGGVRGPDFAAWTLAALLDVDLLDAEDLLEELVEAQLVGFARLDVTGTHRYRCHDLLRVYAAEKAATVFDDATRRRGRERLYSGYLALLLEAMSLLGPGKDLFLAEAVPLTWHPPGDVVAGLRAVGAVEWFTDERAGLVAASRQAFEDQTWPYVWGIVDVLNGLFVARHHGEESLELKDLALGAARKAGDAVAEAGVLNSYAAYHLNNGAHAEAVRVLTNVVERYDALGLVERKVRTMLFLAVVERDRGRLTVSADLLEPVLAVLAEGDDELIHAAAEHNYAIVLREQGWLQRADEVLAHCIPVFDRHGDTGLGRLLHTRALLKVYLGRLDDADADLAEARPHCMRGGDIRWTGIVDLARARVLGHRGRWSDLLDGLAECEREFEDGEDRQGLAQVWRTRAAALRALGQPDDAIRLYAEALAVYQGVDDIRAQAKLRYGLALTLLRSGDPRAAAEAFTTALEVFADLDDLPWQLRTRRWQAELAAAAGEADAARAARADVRRLGATLVERAGAGHRPAWLDPFVAAAR